MRVRVFSMIVSGTLLAGVADLRAQDAPAPVQVIPALREVTGSIPRTTGSTTVSPALKSALDALASRQASQALAIRDTMPEGTLDRHVLTWAIAVSGQSQVPASEIIDAKKELQGWPGLSGLRLRNGTGDRRAQLVGSIGRKRAFGLERAAQPVQQLVDPGRNRRQLARQRCIRQRRKILHAAIRKPLLKIAHRPQAVAHRKGNGKKA